MNSAFAPDRKVVPFNSAIGKASVLRPHPPGRGLRSDKHAIRGVCGVARPQMRRETVQPSPALQPPLSSPLLVSARLPPFTLREDGRRDNRNTSEGVEVE